jgi:hypothetical protein
MNCAQHGTNAGKPLSLREPYIMAHDESAEAGGHSCCAKPMSWHFTQHIERTCLQIVSIYAHGGPLA